MFLNILSHVGFGQYILFSNLSAARGLVKPHQPAGKRCVNSCMLTYPGACRLACFPNQDPVRPFPQCWQEFSEEHKCSIDLRPSKTFFV